MKLTRIFSGLAPALAAVAFIGLATPVATLAQTNPPAAAPAAAAPAAPGSARGGQARSSRDAGLRRRSRRGP